MRYAALAIIFLALAGCGGKETEDIDAEVSDASFDLSLHLGECCDTTLGGLGQTCTAEEIEAGAALFIPCPSNQYCGLIPADEHGPAQVTCCLGQKLPGFTSTTPGCPPWPGSIEVGWGNCCYLIPDSGTPIVSAGGVPGPCAADAAAPHIQCGPDQYCGVSDAPDADPTHPQRCCGDRTQDHGTLDATGVDPDCPPQFASGSL